jgi:hypothetical protein
MPAPFQRQPTITRIGVLPDEPAEGPPAIVGRRPRGRGRLCTDAEIAHVRRLVEGTTLTHSEIAKRTGVSICSISRWRNDFGWQRPVFAPRSTDMMPTARASARRKRRMLAARLEKLAARYVRELEESARIDPDKLAEALELATMARLAATPHRRRRHRPDLDFSVATGERLRPVMQLVAAGVDLNRAPREAIDDFLEHREPPKEKPPRHGRGRRSRLDREHAWLLERERS